MGLIGLDLLDMTISRGKPQQRGRREIYERKKREREGDGDIDGAGKKEKELNESCKIKITGQDYSTKKCEEGDPSSWRRHVPFNLSFLILTTRSTKWTCSFR